MLSSSSPTRDLPISAEQVTKDSAGAMESLTSSTVTSNLSLQQPKIEIDMFSQDDLDLVPSQQLEAQLLDSMDIVEHQSSQSHSLEVFDDECMEELDGNIKMLSPGDMNSACIDDMPPTQWESQSVILGTSSTASNATNAPILKIGFEKRLKHGDRLRKYIRDHGKIPVNFRKKDGHPTGKYASVFMAELGMAVRNIVPLKISGWRDVTEEQKQRIFDKLEVSSFAVDFGSEPNSLRKETENLMNIRFRNHRRYMHRHYKTLNHLPWEERLKCVPTEYCESEADWEFMCITFESEAFKKKSAINSENAKLSYTHHRASKPLTQYKYDTVASSNETDTNPEKGRQEESATIANTGSDNHDDGSQSLERVDAAKRARDQIQDNRAGYISELRNGVRNAKSKRACDQGQDNRAGYVSGLRNGVENARSTSSDDTSRTVTKAELRNSLASTQNELNSTKLSLQLTQDKVRFLEANQKRLEERIDANERVMKLVFERIASDITQSLTQLPSSAPRL